MWKKILIGIVALVGTFSIAYAYYNIEMKASNTICFSGGGITGRLGDLQKGDRVLLDSTPNTSWQLVQNITGLKGNKESNVPIKRQSPYQAWATFSSKSISTEPLVNSISTFSKSYGDSAIAKGTMSQLNTQLNDNTRDMEFVSERIEFENVTYPTAAYQLSSSEIGSKAYIPMLFEIRAGGDDGGSISLNSNELAFSEQYWTANSELADGSLSVWRTITKGGIPDSVDVAAIPSYAVRPMLNLSFQDVVFSMEPVGLSDDALKIEKPSLSSKLYESKGNAMKVRVHNSALDMTFSDIQMNGKSVNTVKEGDKIDLIADAPKGSDAQGTWTISALFYNQNGDFLFYKPIKTSNGPDSYKLDLANIPYGAYKIALVNESFNENNQSPADCSSITNELPLEIVPELTLTVITTPQGQNIFEYSKNVTMNSQVATITSIGGVSPISYSIVSNTTELGHENDYQKFDVITTNGITNIIVKEPDGLSAGDYYFKVKAIDANDTVVSGVESNTVHIVVVPTSTSIVFNDKTTTKKSITDASAKWSEIATATPAAGTKVTYSISSGDVGLIDIDPDSGEITYKGNGSFGSVKIKATVDDDPSTGNDNYEPSSTEKEIIIFKEVGGYVKPDSKSSSITDPTFTAADENIKSGGTIGMIIGEDGTPDTIGGNTTSYTYDLDKTSTNANFFLVDKSTGKITTTANLSTGTYNIIVTVSDKWSTKNIPVTINVGMAAAEDLKFYEDSTASKPITKKNVSFTDKNVVVFATVKGSSNNQKVKYYIKDNSTNVITVNENTGAVEIKGVGKVTVVAKKAGVTGQAEAVSELEFEVTSGSFIFKYVDDAGQELNKTGDKYNAYKEIFAKDKKFQVYTNKAPDGITVTYELKDQSAAMSDVISVDSTTGEVTIINASKTNQMGKIVIIATAHDPSGTYSDQSIELPIIIEKGTRVVSFADDPIYVASGKGSITPVIHVDGIPETEGKANISIEDNSADGIVWTDDTKTIEYEYSKEEAKDIQLKVTLPADRNYNIAEASGTLHIMGANDNALTISTPGKIMYGDNFTIKSTQDDEGSTNVQYTFEVDDTTYISAPTITGKEAVFDALKATGTNTVTVTVTRTADGELPSSKKVNIKVLPKPIEIIIDHKEKLKGEPNPTLTYQDFNKQLVSWNGTQDVIQANDIKLNTTAKATSEANDYPIKGDCSTLNKTYPNYTFAFKENTLTITEENIEDEWYHLELDNGKNTTYKGTWTNQDVNIISDHIEYVNMSKDQSTWETPQIKISSEGKIEQSFWMKKNSGAITSEKKETILIDKTAPTIKTITATDTNNKLQNIINQLTGGIFFKPGTQFEITTSDAKDDLDTSGTSSIEYKIYKQNEDKTYGSPIKQDTLTVTNEKAKITIADTTGTYKICVLPKDKAGNAAEEETCKEITLKKINIDIDGDGNDDFNDPDGDGCPDLNIVLGKDSDGEWIKLNIDTNNDNLPDLNIDTNGDGIADINVDQDGDGIPDLNIVKVTTWNPTVCVTGQAEEYCTDGTIIPNINVDLTGDGRPDINIDLNSDGIPDIDIDTDGDGKPDINIDTNKDGTADENLKKMSEWKIDAEVFEVKNIKFQTMKGLIRDTLDSLEDNGIVLEPGDGSIFLPNHAIKVTEISDEKIQESINQQTENQEVKKIYDVKFLKDNIEAKPDGTMKVKIPLPDGIKNPQLMVQKSDGSYEKVNATLEDGYLVYETNEVGIVSIIGDKEENIDPVPDEPEDPEEPKGEEPEKPTLEEPDKPTEPKVDQPEPQPTVQGTYTTGLGNNMGGASTGDGTYAIIYFTVTLISLSILLIIFRKRSLH